MVLAFNLSDIPEPDCRTMYTNAFFAGPKHFFLVVVIVAVLIKTFLRAPDMSDKVVL